MAARKTPPTDFTGRNKERLEKEREEELARRENLAMTRQAEKSQAYENEVVDVTTGPNPTVVDEVQVVESDTDDTVVVRVADDLENVTIGKKTYDFEAGRKYRVPRNVAFVLRESGRLYDRA